MVRVHFVPMCTLSSSGMNNPELLKAFGISRGKLKDEASYCSCLHLEEEVHFYNDHRIMSHELYFWIFEEM